MLTWARRTECGTVLLMFPAAALIMIVLGAIAVDVSLSQVRARELEMVAASAANDALGALDVEHLRATSEIRFDPALAKTIVTESVATGPLPSADIRSITITDLGGATPQIAVTLTLVVELIMSPALPGGIGSTTITRTRTVSILG